MKILDRPDFNNIVKFALKRFRLKSPLNIEDLSHEVKVSIFSNMRNREVPLAETTIICYHTRWVVKRKWKVCLPTVSLPKDVPSTESSTFNRVDEVDEAEYLLDCPLINPDDVSLLLSIAGGKSCAEIAKELGVKRQNINEIYHNRINKVRKYYENWIGYFETARS